MAYSRLYVASPGAGNEPMSSELRARCVVFKGGTLSPKDGEERERRGVRVRNRCSRGRCRRQSTQHALFGLMYRMSCCVGRLTARHITWYIPTGIDDKAVLFLYGNTPLHTGVPTGFHYVTTVVCLLCTACLPFTHCHRLKEVY